MAGILEGKVAVITGVGADHSMGATAARLFHAEGASLVLADISGLETEVAGSLPDRAVACNVDVREADQVEQMINLAIEAYGGLDILCNVAGIPGLQGRIADTTEADFTTMIDINLRGVFLAMRSAIPHMIRRGGGSIVNIASTAALIGVAELGIYAASKAGVVALTKTAAVEYGGQNIRSNVICPGVIETPMYDAGVAANPGMVDYLKGLIPMGRTGKPNEIAETMLFLASERSSYINGVVLPVEGGQTAA